MVKVKGDILIFPSPLIYVDASKAQIYTFSWHLEPFRAIQNLVVQVTSAF